MSEGGWVRITLLVYFFSCVSTKALPAAKMPWGYLSLKNNMYSQKS